MADVAERLDVPHFSLAERDRRWARVRASWRATAST